ncbi:MAG TPA: hypothetical protein VGH22_21200 [Candidatus Binatia bacterium]|jgi:hypothetical protein
MKLLKIDDSDLTQACQDLRAANDAATEADKKQKAAKDMIRRRLYELRELNLEILPIGEKVYVDKLLLIEVAKQNRFDTSQYKLDCPEQYQSYCKEFAVVKMKPEV